MFGGEPHVLFCSEAKEEAAKRLDGFAKAVVAELEKATNGKDKVRAARVKCGVALPGSSKPLKEMVKLKREHPSLPVMIFASNGQPAKQVKATSFTSPVKGAKGSVELNAGKLARKLVANSVVKPTALASNDQFSKECLMRKYQVCVVLAKKGGIERVASAKLSRLLAEARANRFARLFYVDTSKHTLSLDSALPTLQDEALVAFRRKDFVFSSDPAHAPPSSKPKPKPKEAAGEADKASPRDPLAVSGSEFSSSSIGGGVVALSSGLKMVAKAQSAEDRLAAFLKYQVVAPSAALELKPPKGSSGSLAVLIRPSSTSSQGFVLDWAAAAPHVLRLAAFGESGLPGAKELAKLQEASLARAAGKGPSSSKSKAVEGHYVGVHAQGLGSDTDVAAFLRSALTMKGSKHFLPFAKRPMLSKRVTKPSAPSPSRSKSASSKPPPAARSKAPAGGSSADKTKEQIEREFRRRQEMEEEALRSGVYAMPQEDDEPSDLDDDQDDDSADDLDAVEEITLDDEEAGDEGQDGDESEGEEDDGFDEEGDDEDEDDPQGEACETD